jgi:hypothetical protein
LILDADGPRLALDAAPPTPVDHAAQPDVRKILMAM